MDEPTVRIHAQTLRGEAGVTEGFLVNTVEDRSIQISRRDAMDRVLVRDYRVWIVRLTHGPAWIELALERETGALLRVERSRS